MKISKLILFAPLFLLFACKEEIPVPKPPTYLRLEIPASVYRDYTDSCGFSFEMPETFSIKSGTVNDSMCNRVIDLGPLNGSLFLYYWDVNKPLSFYINNANDEVGNHKLKATSIYDSQIRRNKDRVFGTKFELQGNVATPFQFYLTDSTDRFIFAEVLFNSSPNYDSLKPTLDHFHKDLDKILETFQWKK